MTDSSTTDIETPGAGAAEVRPRRAWLAGLLSLVASGLGQLYNGQWQKGLLFFGAELALGLGFFVVFDTFAGMILNLSSLVALNVYALIDAVIVARRSREYRLASYNRWWVYLLAGLVSLGVGNGLELTLEAYGYESYRAPSGSMIPTLLVGDHFMVESLAPGDPVRRGDVVVFFERKSGKHFVKRVIGLPGEAVSMRDRQVLVGGKPLEEPYLNAAVADGVTPRDNMAPVRLGMEQYLLLGDNRDHSYDSRWLGPVRRADILGRALYIYWPGEPRTGGRFDRLGKEIR
jgi:signal peptidase I